MPNSITLDEKQTSVRHDKIYPMQYCGLFQHANTNSDSQMTDWPNDLFGDPFELAHLPLPRPALGYGIQEFDTGHALNPYTQSLQTLRASKKEVIFSTYAEAFQQGINYLQQKLSKSHDHNLCITPIGYDEVMERPVWILGVLWSEPEKVDYNRQNDYVAQLLANNSPLHHNKP